MHLQVISTRGVLIYEMSDEAIRRFVDRYYDYDWISASELVEILKDQIDKEDSAKP